MELDVSWKTKGELAFDTKTRLVAEELKSIVENLDRYDVSLLDLVL